MFVSFHKCTFLFAVKKEKLEKNVDVLKNLSLESLSEITELTEETYYEISAQINEFIALVKSDSDVIKYFE